MYGGDFDIDIVPAIEYATNKVLGYLGKDPQSLLIKGNIEKRIKKSIIDSSQVQCIGMPNPIPIKEIFQPINLKLSQYSNSNRELSIEEALNQKNNKIIFGGPGAGKSVLMNWLFLSNIKTKDTISILFRLREPNAIIELEEFIKVVSDTKFIKKKQRVLLLIDGYDEVGVKIRKEISYLLKTFESNQKGNYILTCRLHYSIIDLKAQYYFLQPFKLDQSIEFTKTYLKLYNVHYDAEKLINELIDRGFIDFLRNPLLLTLVCVLKTGPFPQLPKNTIGLIERSIQTLTRKWDDSRGIAREPSIVIDGEDRIKCLTRIAYHFNQPIGSESMALRHAEIQLKKIQLSHINPHDLLIEIAQWYGLFVPVEDSHWEFAHRTIHDYLAAKFWINTGAFSASKISHSMWNERTAYAASLVEDSTSIIHKALKHATDESVFIECLKNNASFDTMKVAKQLRARYKKLDDHWKLIVDDRDPKNVIIRIKPNVFKYASDDLIKSLIEVGSYTKDDVNTLIYVIALIEYSKRDLYFQFEKRIDLENYLFEFDDEELVMNDIYK